MDVTEAGCSRTIPCGWYSFRQSAAPHSFRCTGSTKRLYWKNVVIRRFCLTKLLNSPNINRMNKSGTISWMEQVMRMGDVRNAYKILVGKLKGRITWKTWEDNIKTDLVEIESKCVDNIDATQDRDQWWGLVNTIVNIRVPEKPRNFTISWGSISFWRTLLNGLS
jgi:hypothetical protein